MHSAVLLISTFDLNLGGAEDAAIKGFYTIPWAVNLAERNEWKLVEERNMLRVMN
jgi:hypothetical protein